MKKVLLFLGIILLSACSREDNTDGCLTVYDIQTSIAYNYPTQGQARPIKTWYAKQSEGDVTHIFTDTSTTVQGTYKWDWNIGDKICSIP